MLSFKKYITFAGSRTNALLSTIAGPHCIVGGWAGAHLAHKERTPLTKCDSDDMYITAIAYLSQIAALTVEVQIELDLAQWVSAKKAEIDT